MFEDISPVKKPIDNITNLQSSHMFMKVYELYTSPPPPPKTKNKQFMKQGNATLWMMIIIFIFLMLS
jgi:hypothetical protein